MYQYKARIIRVVDGDTAYAIVDLGFNTSVKINFRLAFINTPELLSTDKDERSRAMLSRDRLVDLIEGKDVYLKSYRKDKYGRWLGEFFLNENDKVSVNQLMLDEGLAVKYQ
jgi:micrococcal nuclease